MVVTPHEDQSMDSGTTHLNIDRNGNCLEREEGEKNRKMTHFQAQCILARSFVVFDINKMDS